MSAKRRSRRARSPGATARQRSKAAAARAMAASTSGAVGRVDGGDDLGGGRVEHRHLGVGGRGVHPVIMARGDRRARRTDRVPAATPAGPSAARRPHPRWFRVTPCHRTARRRPAATAGEPPGSTWPAPSRRWPGRSPIARAWSGGTAGSPTADGRAVPAAGLVPPRAGAGRPRPSGRPWPATSRARTTWPSPSTTATSTSKAMIGAYRARVAPFNVNYRYVGEELRYLLADARARAVVYHASLAPILAEVLARRPADRGAVAGGRRIGQRPAARRGRVRGGAGRRLARGAPGRTLPRRPLHPLHRAAPRACPRACSGASTTSSWPPWAGAGWEPGSSSTSYEELAAQAAAGTGSSWACCRR